MIGSFWFNSFSAGGGGAAADYELISTTVLGSSAASVTFSGLGTSAAAYKHLQIRAAIRTDYTSPFNDCYLQFNGVTSSSYSWHQLYGYNGSVGSSAGSSTVSIDLGSAVGASNAASAFSAMVVDIADFQSTSKNKTLKSLSGGAGSTGGTNSILNLYSGAWYSTSAVTSFLIYPSSGNFVTGSRFSLYGLKA